MALIYAARFPGKVRRLVLAGAPIDISAGNSGLSELARNTPMATFRGLVELGDGRALGRCMLKLWARDLLEREAMTRALQVEADVGSAAFRRLERRFRDWYRWAVDLPGTYYLQVVDQLFKENRLARGRFVALGRTVDLSALHCPLHLVAASDDQLVAPQQLFATERLVDAHACALQKTTATCDHLGLFMGQKTLSGVWPRIADWLSR
jgi:poly-beta-hydroxyalkanoate depolymerase